MRTEKEITTEMTESYKTTDGMRNGLLFGIFELLSDIRDLLNKDK